MLGLGLGLKIGWLSGGVALGLEPLRRLLFGVGPDEAAVENWLGADDMREDEEGGRLVKV